MQEKTFTQAEVDQMVNDRLAQAQDSEYKEKYDELARKLEEEKAESDFLERFSKVAEGKEFVNDLTKEGVYGLFKKAVTAPDNAQKTDGELYETIMKDNDYYKNPNKPSDMQPMGTSNILDDSIKQVMGLER